MKRPICTLMMLIFIFLCGCSSSGNKESSGSAQSEEANKAKAENVKPAEKTIGDKFRTDMGPVNGLTTKGQKIKITTEQAIKTIKGNPKKPAKSKAKTKSSGKP